MTLASNLTAYVLYSDRRLVTAELRSVFVTAKITIIFV